MLADVNALARREIWQAFAPRLHIEDPRSFADIPFLNSTPEQDRGVAAMLKHEGYVHAAGVNWGLDIGLMAETVRALSRAQLSPVFAYLYDEFWLPYYQMHRIYSGVLGDYRMLPDFWIWNVDPKAGDSGWKPHRDKGHYALFPDRSPKSLTTWIALSAATPLNGCMYIVPAYFDPTYGTPEDETWKFGFESARALPAAPGDVFMWNQAVAHWGSRCSPYATETRVSMAFEFQRADVEPFNQPLLDRKSTRLNSSH